MAFAKIWRVSKEFQPAAVGSDETKALFQVKAGWRVVAASARVLTNAAEDTDTTVSLGDTDEDGYIAAIDLESTTGLVNGAGALLATSGGKLYTEDDTIDAVYAGTTYGAVNPKVRFTIHFMKDED